MTQFVSTGDKEADTRCRRCGYNTTDEERKAYGIFQKDEDGNILKAYYHCVFCVESEWTRWKLFKSLDEKIHDAKIRLRKKYLHSGNYLYLTVLRAEHEKLHYDEIHNAPYKEDDFGFRAYNEHEFKFACMTEEIVECLNRPRHLYLEALEEFGGESDEPPCARNLSTVQKKKLLKKLKAL